MSQMPKAGPGHQKLYVLAGDWEGVEKMLPSPYGPGGDATGHMTARVDIDGFFVISDYRQEKDGAPAFRGHGVYGYDPQSDEYTWYWVDSMGMPASVSRGKWLGDTLTFESSHPGGGGGRYVYRFEGSDKHHFRIENSFDGGQTWNTFMEASYVRKA